MSSQYPSSQHKLAKGALRIVADENIPSVQDIFCGYGEVETRPGRHIGADDLRQADVLLVRSVTQVGANLLAKSPVKFVGSATIGTDHLDIDYLQSHHIAWTNAPGSNARSVVEYVLAALCQMSVQQGEADWRHKTVAVVGCGQVGGRLCEQLLRLGCRVLPCDPPLARLQQEGLNIAEQHHAWVSLEQALTADVICLHTPLVVDGPHPTQYLLGAEQLAGLQSHQWLLNAGRGDVIDNQALKRRLQQPDAPLVALDVWANEPNIDVELAQMLAISTPHIAGYSLDGKLAGVAMLAQALSRWLAVPSGDEGNHAVEMPVWQAALEQRLPTVDLCVSLEHRQDWRRWVLAAYPIARDHHRLCATLSDLSGFDRLRKHYPERREFARLRIAPPAGLAEELALLGFVLD